MTDTERLDWLEAELKRGKAVAVNMHYDPNKALYDGTFTFFTVHSQHLKATDLREVIDRAASMKRIL